MNMNQKVFYIKTYGCQMNERDSEIMAQSLSAYGYVEGIGMEEADLVIINTCSIRAKAEQKVMSQLGYLRKAKKKNPRMKICVAGCVAQQEGEKIVEKMPHVDLVVGTQNIYNIGQYIQEGTEKVATTLSDNYSIPKFLPDVEDFRERHGSEKIFRKFVTIMQGCNNYCSYCVVPYTRGREVSRKAADILDEVDLLVRSGVKEITLLGQNVNSYGKSNNVIPGTGTYSFADLLQDVSSTPGLERLRFTTSNPKDLTDDLISCFGSIRNLCPQFHLPVQAGSNAVLRRMNRKYTVEDYLEKVHRLHEQCSEIALTTDIIVGFPGESGADFEGTMTLLETVRFHGSFSFKYSDRPGTKAYSFTDKIDENIKTERLAKFQKRQDEISLERNEEYIGLVKDVMLEECASSNGTRGRTNTNHIVHIKEKVDARPGDIVKVRITFAGQHSLKGDVV